jgi:hypothetical protein
MSRVIADDLSKKGKAKNILGKNLLINGGFDVWQRGESFTLTASTNQFLADRWNTQNSVDGVVSQSSENVLTYDGAIGAGPSDGIEQRIEDLKGLVYHSNGLVTASFKVTQIRANTHSSSKFYSWNYADGNYISDSLSITGSGVYSITFDVSVLDFSDLASFSFWFGDGKYELSECQLEVGSVATEFENRSYGEELFRCKRYFERINSPDSYHPIGTGFSSTSSLAEFLVSYSEKRVLPTSQISSVSHFATARAGTNITATSVAVDQLGTKICRVLNLTAGHTAGEGCHIVITTPTGYIDIDAEL